MKPWLIPQGLQNIKTLINSGQGPKFTRGRRGASFKSKKTSTINCWPSRGSTLLTNSSGPKSWTSRYLPQSLQVKIATMPSGLNVSRRRRSEILTTKKLKGSSPLSRGTRNERKPRVTCEGFTNRFREGKFTRIEVASAVTV